MRSLLLSLLLCCSLSADKFVFHVGYHTDTQARAFALANSATGNTGINVNCDKDTANQNLAIGSLILFCTWLMYKIYQIEQNQKKKE